MPLKNGCRVGIGRPATIGSYYPGYVALLVGNVFAPEDRSLSFEIARKIILIVVDFHAHGSSHVDTMQCNGQTCTQTPVSTGITNVHVPVQIIVYVVILVVNIPGTFMVMANDDRLSVVMPYCRMHYMSVAMAMGVMFVAIMMFVVLVFVVLVFAVVSMILVFIVTTVGSFMRVMMTPSLCLCVTRYADDEQCDHQRKKLRCCFHFTWG